MSKNADVNDQNECIPPVDIQHLDKMYYMLILARADPGNNFGRGQSHTGHVRGSQGCWNPPKRGENGIFYPFRRGPRPFRREPRPLWPPSKSAPVIPRGLRLSGIVKLAHRIYCTQFGWEKFQFCGRKKLSVNFVTYILTLLLSLKGQTYMIIWILLLTNPSQ